MTKLVVGLTGGIASGKSLVSSHFKQLNVDVIDADLIARDLFAANSPHLDSLRKHFGDSIFNLDSTLNRKALGKIVFSDPNQLTWLNQLTHPLVAKEILRQLALSRSPYVILDIPLLIKKDGTLPNYLKDILDRILVVETSEENQIARVTKRDNLSAEQAKRIISAQATEKQRKQHADDIVDNNSDLKFLKNQTDKLHQYYLSKSLA